MLVLTEDRQMKLHTLVALSYPSSFSAFIWAKYVPSKPEKRGMELEFVKYIISQRAGLEAWECDVVGEMVNNWDKGKTEFKVMFMGGDVNCQHLHDKVSGFHLQRQW
jgi:hypothetical protein